MALSDVIIPAVYKTYQVENSPEKTAFVESGVIVKNPSLDTAASGGQLVNLPFWRDLDGAAEANVSDGNPANTGATQKLTAGEQIARVANVNNGWTASDLEGELAGAEPMTRTASRTSAYWLKQWQRRVISTASGVMADNIASNAGDMVNDVSIADGAAAGAANVFSRGAFTAAAFTMGDGVDGLSMIAVHSMVYKRMVDNNDITFVKPSEGAISIPTFLGKAVVVDDSMPVVAGATSGFKYTSILFGAGAFGFGEGAAKMPVEIERTAAGGNGGGIETLWERKSWIIHPLGYKFNNATVSGASPTIANLALAANWTRVIDRKSVPMAFLITNG